MKYLLILFLLVGLPFQSHAQSAVATLSALDIDGLLIRPIPFTSASAGATVAVENSVTSVTITPTTADANATIAWFGRNDVIRTDADTATAGFQVSLVVGDNNFIKLTVTAEDGTTTQDYNIWVNRDSTEACAGPALAADRQFIWEGRFIIKDVTFGSGQSSGVVYGWFLSSGISLGGYLGSEEDRKFSLGTEDYEFDGFVLYRYANTNHANHGNLLVGTFAALSATTLADLQVHICADTLEFSNATQGTGNSISHYTWSNTSLDWSTTDAITMRLSSAKADPVFANTTETRSFTESVGGEMVATPMNLGSPIEATDYNHKTLTYSLEGTDATLFQVADSSGQLQTKEGENYDYETQTSFAVTVKADDGQRGTDTVDVTIDITDTSEPPLKVENLAVVSMQGSTSLDVMWDAPDNTGRPAITTYKVEYREAGASWTNLDSAGRAVMITNLSLGTHEVRVRAVNAEGDGPWTDPPMEGSITAFPLGKPTSPVISHNTSTPNSLYLGWVDPTETGGSAIISYEVEYSIMQGTTQTRTYHLVGDADLVTTSAAGRTARLRMLALGTDYSMRVRARNAVEFGPWSDVTTGTLAAPPPTPPQQPQPPRGDLAQQVTGVEITPRVEELSVSWDEFAGASAYRIQWRPAEGEQNFDDEDTVTGGSTTSYTITGLIAGTEYTVRVTAILSDTESLPSEATDTPLGEGISRPMPDMGEKEGGGGGCAIGSDVPGEVSQSALINVLLIMSVLLCASGRKKTAR